MERGARRGLVAGAAVLALAALGAALLAGCGGGAPAEASSPATIRVTPAGEDRGTTVDAKVGDTVVVSLEANATTGYEWTIHRRRHVHDREERVRAGPQSRPAGRQGRRPGRDAHGDQGRRVRTPGHLRAKLGDAVAGRRSGLDGDGRERRLTDEDGSTKGAARRRPSPAEEPPAVPHEDAVPGGGRAGAAGGGDEAGRAAREGRPPVPRSPCRTAAAPCQPGRRVDTLVGEASRDDPR